MFAVYNVNYNTTRVRVAVVQNPYDINATSNNAF